MRDKTITRKPIQAGDYGQPETLEKTPETPAADIPSAATAQATIDGRKTLALWSH